MWIFIFDDNHNDEITETVTWQKFIASVDAAADALWLFMKGAK